MNFFKKNILLITPKFLGYEIAIKNFLKSKGAYVSMYDERPSSNPLVKALIRINPKILEFYSNFYFSNILNNEREIKFDYILVIKGEALSYKLIKKMKIVFPKSKFIFYSWDSLKNYKYTSKKIHLFDKAYSFDRDDCKNSDRISYLPLFFSYESSLTKNTLNDIVFIASLHSDRYKVLQKTLKNINLHSKHINFDIFLYYSSKLFFVLRKIFDKNFRKIPYSEVNWIPISQRESADRINNAKIVIDINHPNQSGLTMRTIEAVALKKKIITTNRNILHEEFYDENNILVIDRYNPIISKDFIEMPYKEISEGIIKKYKIDSWAEEIFND